MNATRFAIVAILGSAVIFGALMYYQLVYAGYVELTKAEVGEIQLINVTTGNPEPLLLGNVKGIDSVVDGVRLSSSVSYRACFQTQQSQAKLMEVYVIIDDAVPLTAPPWFDCFDARAIGQSLEDGDRVVAVLPNGHGFVWHQLNTCGNAVFAGDPTPDGCPELPEDF
jgi:hypothetical protein